MPSSASGSSGSARSDCLSSFRSVEPSSSSDSTSGVFSASRHRAGTPSSSCSTSRSCSAAPPSAFSAEASGVGSASSQVLAAASDAQDAGVEEVAHGEEKHSAEFPVRIVPRFKPNQRPNNTRAARRCDDAEPSAELLPPPMEEVRRASLASASEHTSATASIAPPQKKPERKSLVFAEIPGLAELLATPLVQVAPATATEAALQAELRRALEVSEGLAQSLRKAREEALRQTHREPHAGDPKVKPAAALQDRGRRGGAKLSETSPTPGKGGPTSQSAPQRAVLTTELTCTRRSPPLRKQKVLTLNEGRNLVATTSPRQEGKRIPRTATHHHRDAAMRYSSTTKRVKATLQQEEERDAGSTGKVLFPTSTGVTPRTPAVRGSTGPSRSARDAVPITRCWTPRVVGLPDWTLERGSSKVRRRTAPLSNQPPFRVTNRMYPPARRRPSPSRKQGLRHAVCVEGTRDPVVILTVPGTPSRSPKPPCSCGQSHRRTSREEAWKRGLSPDAHTFSRPVSRSTRRPARHAVLSPERVRAMEGALVGSAHPLRSSFEVSPSNYFAWRTCHQALDELQRLLLEEEALRLRQVVR